MAEGDTLLNALIGAVVGTVLAFIPFSTVLGGAVAGYLQKGTRNDGLRVGAIAGVIALIPFVLVVVFGFGAMFAFLPFAGGMGGPMGPGPSVGIPVAGLAVFAVIALLFGLVYVVALYAVGGWIGNYLATDADL